MLKRWKNELKAEFNTYCKEKKRKTTNTWVHAYILIPKSWQIINMDSEDIRIDKCSKSDTYGRTFIHLHLLKQEKGGKNGNKMVK